MNPAVLMIACIASLSVGKPIQSTDKNALPLGFVNHYPMIRHMDDRLGESGANVVIMRAPWALLEPAEGRFEFGMLDEQLALASRQGIRFVILMEAGPAHASGVPWLMAKLREAGHVQMDMNGNPSKDPSIFSPIYKRYLARYLRTVTTYVKGHRLSSSVYGYNNGCEWWYPISQSYGPLAEEAFRQYLRTKYRTIHNLNDAWGASVSGWDEVRPPRLVWLGSNRSSQAVMVPASAQLDACYATSSDSHVPVRPGEHLTFSVHWRAPNTRAGGVTAEIAWLAEGKTGPIRIDQSPLMTGGRPAVCTAKAPEGSNRAWLLAKSMAVGEVAFTRLSCIGADGTEMAPNPDLDPSRGGWTFIRWSAGEPDRVRGIWERRGEAVIRYDSTMALDTPCMRPLAAVADWTDFRAHSMAEFIDWMAAQIRAVDSKRPVISYLTFAFANPFEWDYAQQMAIQIEHWAPAARHQQVLGMQLASAEGDPDSVTCALDMARKYGKPMWAVDLLDFTRGTALGGPALTQLSRAVLEHGGAGIQYYCWWGTPHYNYLDLGFESVRKMLADTRAYYKARSMQRAMSDIALVLPRMPLYGPLGEPPNDWADFMGWYKLLRHLGARPDVYALEELQRADLPKHRLIIVPDCAYLPGEAVRALNRAARAGAKMISSGRFGLFDRTGRALGAHQSPTFFRRISRPVGAVLLGETYRQLTPTDTPPRLVCRPGYPDWNCSEAREALDALRDAGIETEPSSP